MSGDAGWLITLGADGHTREREADEENGPLRLSASGCHFLPLYLTLSHYCLSLLVSVDPYLCPSVVCLIYEWLSQAYCSGKVSTWPALMTFSFSIYSKCFYQTQAGNHALFNWIWNASAHTTLTYTHHWTCTNKYVPLSNCEQRHSSFNCVLRFAQATLLVSLHPCRWRIQPVRDNDGNWYKGSFDVSPSSELCPLDIK